MYRVPNNKKFITVKFLQAYNYTQMCTISPNIITVNIKLYIIIL